MDKIKARLASLILKLKASSPLEMAKYASSHTKFYSRLYDGYSLDDFESLPVFTKYDLSGVSPYDLLSDEFRDKAYLYAETSGSSGSPTPSFFAKKEFDGLVMLSLLSPYSSAMREAAKENRTAVNGLTFGFTIAGFTFGAILQRAGFMVAQVGTRSTIAPPERMAKTIAKLKPSAISATPLDLMSWLWIVKTDFPDDYQEVLRNLKFLLSTAEPCALSRQRQIEDFFGITQINTYASVDGLASVQCPCGEMHLLDNLLDVELFERNMEPVGHYGKGRLCFTNQVKKSTPMVRYLLDDLVTVRKSDCKYGYAKSIIPHGRYELSVDINGCTLGSIDFEEIIFRHGLFMNYNLEISDDRTKLMLEEYDSSLRHSYDISELRSEIAEATGLECDITIVPLGKMTQYRGVRAAKSVIKVLDRRSESRQELPIIL